jgi:hypothetical protein
MVSETAGIDAGRECILLAKQAARIEARWE